MTPPDTRSARVTEALWSVAGIGALFWIAAIPQLLDAPLQLTVGVLCGVVITAATLHTAARIRRQITRASQDASQAQARKLARWSRTSWWRVLGWRLGGALGRHGVVLLTLAAHALGIGAIVSLDAPRDRLQAALMCGAMFAALWSARAVAMWCARLADEGDEARATLRRVRRARHAQRGALSMGEPTEGGALSVAQGDGGLSVTPGSGEQPLR